MIIIHRIDKIQGKKDEKKTIKTKTMRKKRRWIVYPTTYIKTSTNKIFKVIRRD